MFWNVKKGGGGRNGWKCNKNPLGLGIFGRVSHATWNSTLILLGFSTKIIDSNDTSHIIPVIYTAGSGAKLNLQSRFYTLATHHHLEEGICSIRLWEEKPRALEVVPVHCFELLW